MQESNKVIVFDLDDTLYKEIDYLKSAYQEISLYLETKFGLSGIYGEMLRFYMDGSDVFQNTIEAYHIPLDIDELIHRYRNHKPDICLEEETRQTLKALKGKSYILGIITDGRKVSQWNKIQALGLKEFMSEEDTLISSVIGFEKPSEYAFRLIEDRYKGCNFIYVGDNPRKDFLAPNRLGWKTVCLLDDGRNIHKQVFDLPEEYLPQLSVSSLSDLRPL